MKIKDETTSIRVTRSKRQSLPVDTMVVDLEMDITSIDPIKEKQGLVDEGNNR